MKEVMRRTLGAIITDTPTPEPEKKEEPKPAEDGTATPPAEPAGGGSRPRHPPRRAGSR